MMNGKQVRVNRPPTIDGVSVDVFIMRNADLLWLHQNEMWEYISAEDLSIDLEKDEVDESIPF